jgi:hypothetical protein
MENKQTAVEWVLQYLNNVKPNEFCSIEKIKELLEQAKEMEKQQMIDFADNYVDNCVLTNENMAIPTIMDVPNYYNEQYGGKDGE